MNLKYVFIAFLATVVVSCTSVWAAQHQVKLDGSGDFASIQDAIDLAQDGDLIVVWPGTYYENVRLNGKNLVVRSLSPQDANVVASTVIDGGRAGTVVTFSGTEDESCELSGFTITNGQSVNGGGIVGGFYAASRTQARITSCVVVGNYAEYGGGMYLSNGDVVGCVVKGNEAQYDGGGMFSFHGLISGCTIEGNLAGCGGGGLFRCNGEIVDCTIDENRAEYGGGLYYCDGQIDGCLVTRNSADYGGGVCGCVGAITSCVIVDNAAEYYGGGLYSCYSAIANCLVRGNSATHGGGLYGCEASLTNCTISENHAELGGGLCSSYGPISSCIVWGNVASDGGEFYGISTPFYSCIGNWAYGGEGNISDDPLFTPGPLGDHYLCSLLAGQDAQSPCIDAGAEWPKLLFLASLSTQTDSALDANRVDMGYHYAPVDLNVQSYLNGSEFGPGDAIECSIAVQNAAADLAADVYLAFILPEGSVLCLTQDGLAAGIRPWLTGVILPQGLDFGPSVVYRLAVPSYAPTGPYHFAAALAASGRDYFISLSAAPFTID